MLADLKRGIRRWCEPDIRHAIELVFKAKLSLDHPTSNTNWSVVILLQKVSEYDQEIPQPHTADQLMVPRGRATEHL